MLNVLLEGLCGVYECVVIDKHLPVFGEQHEEVVIFLRTWQNINDCVFFAHVAFVEVIPE